MLNLEKQKMKICKKCNCEIPEKVKFCYNCGSKYGMSKRLKIIIGVIVILIVATIGNNKQDHDKIIAEQQKVEHQQKEKQESDQKSKELQEKSKEVQEKQESERKDAEQKLQENAPVYNTQAKQEGDIIGDSSSHIYHLPTQKHYNIKESNQVHFKTEQEAVNAGYRAAKR